MRAAIFEASGVIKVADRSYPVVTEPTDAVFRVVLACVCGGDLWYYRGESLSEPGPTGHEFIGVVADVGADVRGIAKGDLVIAPSALQRRDLYDQRRRKAARKNPCIAGRRWAQEPRTP